MQEKAFKIANPLDGPMVRERNKERERIEWAADYLEEKKIIDWQERLWKIKSLIDDRYKLIDGYIEKKYDEVTEKIDQAKEQAEKEIEERKEKGQNEVDSQ